MVLLENRTRGFGRSRKGKRGSDMLHGIKVGEGSEGVASVSVSLIASRPIPSHVSFQHYGIVTLRVRSCARPIGGLLRSDNPLIFPLFIVPLNIIYPVFQHVNFVHNFFPNFAAFTVIFNLIFLFFYLNVNLKVGFDF